MTSYLSGFCGPRGDDLPADFDVMGDVNAIWMCETHRSLIDKNEGSNCPPAVLMKWKENAEILAALRQQSQRAPAQDWTRSCSPLSP
jgi:hypothetical protein